MEGGFSKKLENSVEQENISKLGLFRIPSSYIAAEAKLHSVIFGDEL